MNLIFDIETNGFLPELTTVHCIEALNPETKEEFRFTPSNIEEGVRFLMSAETLIGHNIMAFDIPAIQKIYPWFTFNGQIRDTLIISKLIWTDLFDRDMKWIRKHRIEGYKNYGRHGLKAWGQRLGCYKGSYGEDGGESVWLEWSQQMQDYCNQDVKVNLALWEKITAKNYSEEAIQLEHDFQAVILRQESIGWTFDKDAAVDLYGRLSKRRNELEIQLQELFPPYEQINWFTPKANNSTKGYVKGVPFPKPKNVTFNPNSPKQIIKRLVDKYGWKPTEFTKKGEPSTGEDVLSALPYPECKVLVDFAIVTKVIEQLAEGKKGWLKVEKEGKVYARVNTNGTPTGRCTHQIIVNVPRVQLDKDKNILWDFVGGFGADLRSLFTVPSNDSSDSNEDWLLLGCDASGLEMRCLANVMAEYDGGKYIQVVTEGKPHETNRIAMGLDDYNVAKTKFYALIYGAGNENLGDGNSSKGMRIRSNLMKNIPAFKKVDTKCRLSTKQGYQIGIDGRHIITLSAHSALNYSLQSAGSILVKKATVFFNQEMDKRFKWGEEWAQVGHFHDEFQVQVRRRIAEEAGRIAVESFERAGRYFNFKCPITGEFKIGKNWAETH